MIVNNSLCRSVLRNSESHTATAITALLTDIAQPHVHSLSLVTNGRLEADVPAGE